MTKAIDSYRLMTTCSANRHLVVHRSQPQADAGTWLFGFAEFFVWAFRLPQQTPIDVPKKIQPLVRGDGC
jgi:hypothetical protein